MSGDTAHAKEKRAEAIFLSLAELPPDQWPREIEARCSGDTTVVREVKSLLECHAHADQFLDAREIQAASLGFGKLRGDLEDDLSAGVRLGGFQIERLLGRGGMGSVFIAAKDRPRRSVALKVIRRGLATPSLLRRFEHEAEVLGRLHHPGIAQIYEAGMASTGPGEIPRPYIAMELVNGPPLNVFCDQHQLGTHDRLELIAKVCDAVHHAHLRGVIHRDLKPANILVDEHGQPKVLDFGVARAADADLRVTTLQTSVGQLIGTLPYMSPEQVLADPNEVDSRSDVYALGVVMYQLLTGKLPLDLGSRSIPEAARVIKEERPTKLSHISRVFRGEIDTIVSKALEKDKARRYQSAAELAGDIRRHLAGEPIHAKQDSAMYVLRKHLNRYRWAVGAALLMVCGLIAFSTYAGWRARAEQRLATAADAARYEAERAREAADLANEKLQRELFETKIERARVEGTLGNVPLAEDLLWPTYLKNPSSTTAYWALWELYHKYPCRWAVQGLRAPACAAVSPDGSIVVVASRGGEVVVYAGTDGRELWCRSIGRATPTCVAVAPGSGMIFVGLADGRGVLVGRDADPGAGGTIDLVTHPGGIRAAAYSADGRWLATGGNDRKIVLWNAEGRQRIAEWDAHPDAVIALAFSPDGSLLASSARQLTAPSVLARVWDIPAGALAREFTSSEQNYALASSFARDSGSLLLANWNRSVSAGNITDGTVTPVTLPGRSGPLVLARSPDDTSAFVGGLNVVFPIDEPGTPVSLGAQRFPIMAAGWADEHTVLTVSTDGCLRAFDPRPEPGVRRLTEDFNSWCFNATYSPDGSKLAVGGGAPSIMIYDAATLRASAKTPLPRNMQRTRALQFLANSKTLVAGGVDGVVRVIDADTGEVRATFAKSNSEIYWLTLSADERVVYTAHGDGFVRAWDTATGALVATSARADRRVEGVAVSPDGAMLVASGGSDSVQFLDPATLSAVARAETSAPPWGIAYHPDGKSFLVTTYDGTIDVFNAASRARTATLRGHSRLIPAVAFSPDGRMFATGDELGAVKLWDAATLRPLVTFEPGTAEVVTVGFDPSGRHLAAATAFRSVAVFDLRAMDAFIAGSVAYQRSRLDSIDGRP